MAKELFNQTLITSPDEPDDNDRLSFGQPSVSGAKNMLWSYFKTLLQSITSTFDSIQFNTSYTPSSYPEGQLTWNSDEICLDIASGDGPVLQVGQELYILIYNDSGSQYDNGTVLRPLAATLVGSLTVPTVEKAIADTFEGAEGTIMVATMDIPNGTVGLATRFGRVRGLNTNAYTPGDAIYLSATTAGEFTNVRPNFPNYDISLGGVLVQDPTDGEIIISITKDIFDTTLNFWNGVFRETFDFIVTSDGATITGTLTPSNGHDDMTAIFSSGLYMFDTSPGATITLTPGTDSNPQTNYIYIPESTKVLTVSTSGWPTVEHIKVSSVLLQSASKTELDGAFRNQNWNDHIQDTTDNQGHLSHITEKLRQFEAQWDTGVEGSVVIDATPSPDDVYYKNTAGKVFQLHKQDFPIMDMTQYSIDAVSTVSSTFTISDDGDLSSTFPDGRIIKVNDSTGNDGLYTIQSTSYSAPNFVITVEETITDATADGTIGDIIHIVNDETTAYDTTTNLNTILTDSSGGSLAGNSFSFVVWGVQNKGGTAMQLMINKPTDTYNSAAGAISDSLNYSVYDIPAVFSGVGFLIARFTFSLNGPGTTWTLEDTQDLRGKVPNTAAGGGGGGGGTTTFLGLTDTPSSYASQAGKAVIVNGGETALEFGDISGTSISSTSGNSIAEFGNSGSDEFLTVTSNLVKVAEFGDGATHSRIVADPDENYGVSTGFWFGNDAGFYQVSQYLVNFQTSTGVRFQFSTGYIRAASLVSCAMLNEVSTNSNPTLVPYYNDIDTGIGGNGSGHLSLISEGITGIVIDGQTAPGFVQSWINSDGAVGSNTGLAFGDGDSKIFENADDDIYFRLGGSDSWRFRSSQFGGVAGTRPALQNVNVGLSTPTLLPAGQDTNTGIGGNGNDSMSFIVGGATSFQIFESGTESFFYWDFESFISASTTQTQGQAPLSASNNVITTVTNDNDVVTMPSAVEGFEVYICNTSSSNNLQVYPASGDNFLGVATNTSITISPNSSATYMAHNTSEWLPR